MSNIDLKSISIDKDIAISMTKELGAKISQIIKANFSVDNNEKTDSKRDEEIVEELEKVKIEEMFILEEER
ncbi:MAG: hypothetical protein ACRC6T_00875 [Sarcina sp.]